MYEIWKDGAVIARVDRLQHIRKQRDGTIINCGEKEAQGIVVNDTFYHLPWLPMLPGAEDVSIEEFSGNDAIAAMETEIAVLDAALLEAEYQNIIGGFEI